MEHTTTDSKMASNTNQSNNQTDVVASSLLLANQLETKGELQNSLDELNNAVAKMVQQYSSNELFALETNIRRKSWQ